MLVELGQCDLTLCRGEGGVTMVGCGGAASVSRGALWAPRMASKTTAAGWSSVPRNCEQLIRIPSYHTNNVFFLGY